MVKKETYYIKKHEKLLKEYYYEKDDYFYDREAYDDEYRELLEEIIKTELKYEEFFKED